jgi:hypothetical protein
MGIFWTLIGDGTARSTTKRQQLLPAISQSVSTTLVWSETRTWNSLWNTAACQMQAGAAIGRSPQSGLLAILKITDNLGTAGMIVGMNEKNAHFDATLSVNVN